MQFFILSEKVHSEKSTKVGVKVVAKS
jgi:hypothetical protein